MDEMQWSPFIEGLWIARVPTTLDATLQWRMKWNEMNAMSVEKWMNEWSPMDPNLGLGPPLGGGLKLDKLSWWATPRE